MFLYMFYYFFLFLIYFALGVHYKNRLRKHLYLKENFELLGKNERKLKTYFKNKLRTYLYLKTNYKLSKKKNKYNLKLTNTFVSKYYKININDVYNYLIRKKYEYIESDIKITLKYCPFCPPHKYKYDNMYKHEIFKNTGNSYCHRCGYKGSFYDFKLKMGDIITDNFESSISRNTYDEEKITFNDVKMYNINLLYSKEAENARKYLINERKLNLKTIKKYYIGYTVIEFQSFENSGKFEKHECLVFPFLKKIDDKNSMIINLNKNDINEKELYEVVRIKVRSLKDKGYMRLYPKNVREEMKLFFFGDHLVNNTEEVVLTEGEIDAMTISQQTNYSAISLPNGSKSLPIYLLPYLEKFKKIHLWLDFDKAGKSSIFNFVNKIGIARTNVITDTNVQYLNLEAFKKKINELSKKNILHHYKENYASLHQEETKIQETQNENKNKNLDNLNDDKSGSINSTDDTLNTKIVNENKLNQNNLSESKLKSKNPIKEDNSLENENLNKLYFIDNNIMYIANSIQIKDANDCLRHNIDIGFFMQNSEKIKHSQILNFNDLRQNILEELKYPDRINGVKSKTIPSLNKYLYGLRMGELSIWTGSTGVGKTTLLSQLSLDYCIQGVSTLWGSFEINNIKLGKVMLNQFCGKNLEKNIDLFDLYADKFELLSLKFLKFHGSTHLDQVLDAMDYAVYAYDVKHIIIDNLQFMLNINKFSDIYELQNIAIDKFRSFSTNKNVHITLVVHPRKEDANLLSISSVFGSVKSTQEADNVFIIQKHINKSNETIFYIDIKKNRFKGSLGKIPYIYNKENMTIKEIPINYLNENFSTNNYIHNDIASNKFISNNNITNDNINFTLCDEYDYMKQLADEYESKHSIRKNFKNKIVDNSNNIITKTNNNNIIDKNQINKNNEHNLKKFLNNQNVDKNNDSYDSTINDQISAMNMKNGDNSSDINGIISKKKEENIDNKNDSGINNVMKKIDLIIKKDERNIIKNSNYTDNINLLEAQISKKNTKVYENSPKENVTYDLSNEMLLKLCGELKDNKNEILNGKVIIVSLRNCVIDNHSSINDIRNFIKTNKLNIKTAGKNIKKIDIFINILQNIPREYIVIKNEENINKKKKKNKVINGIDKNYNNEIAFNDDNKEKTNIYNEQNSFNKNSKENYSSNKESSKEEIINNYNSMHTFDSIANKENFSDVAEKNINNTNEKYKVEVETNYNDEITKKYIDDNIINIDDNIIKKGYNFEFDNGNEIIKETLYYYEPKKKFDDDIESRFFLINDKNYNEKINYIYKNIKYCGLDIETTGLEVFDEKIRLIQISVENYPVLIYDMFDINNQNIFKGLKEILENKNIVKIIQNGKFDSKFLLHNNFKIENIFDTYIASKLLDKNKNTYGFKLNNIVEKYLNVSLDKQQQNSVWNHSLLNNNQLFYAARDSSCLLKLYKKLKREIKRENLDIVNDIENKCILPICDMELNGIMVDLEKLNKSTNEILNELNIEKNNLKEKLKDEDINVNSQQQVLKALQKNNVRDYSNNLIENTSDSNLKNFMNHEEVAILRNYRRLYKLYSAFYLKLPLHINKNTKKIHTTFNQLKTFSGRFSSEKPNLQQIPRQKNIREIFIPNENNIFIIADFKQIELKIAAEITNDEVMIKAYNNNIDLHTLTASIITKKSINDVNKEDRHIAKAINFGLLYGMNYVNLKNYANTYYNLNMNLDQCLYFYNSFFDHYKGIYRWHNQIKQKKSLEYSTLSNRKVIFPYFSFTKALNYPVQGTCADILKLSLVELYKNLKKINGKIVLCVHDEIIIEAEKKHQEEALKILVESMENSASFFLKKVKCEVSVQIAENWGSKN
ncbi:plastid replication-repair enzyme, putative [Plasmodium gallinaceum]|uniref:Plastid replication-repair enzyme, putative n=1 Tax=Plasmodium gallinaceum TaxID=5849 RepID=A0A1J1GTK9_PLAGA|nr:plastid replication-repair enzyme, putative [Plasmodium gallinaceum]CRG95633.1 plastid replication-repair enzyme, putative [Plasmodium gallinaceum]